EGLAAAVDDYHVRARLLQQNLGPVGEAVEPLVEHRIAKEVIARGGEAEPGEVVVLAAEEVEVVAAEGLVLPPGEARDRAETAVAQGQQARPGRDQVIDRDRLLAGVG